MIRQLWLSRRGDFTSFRAGRATSGRQRRMVSRTPPPTLTSSGLGGGNSLTTISPSLPDRIGVFVVDVDGLDAEAALRRLEAEHGALPPTVEVITARGRHIYFKWPQEPVRNSAGKIGPHIDVRGDGGYVLSPPSIHPSGRRYSWSVDSTSYIAEAPGWLVARQNACCRRRNAIPGMARADRGCWRRRTELQPRKARGPPAAPPHQCFLDVRSAAGLERHQL